MCFNMKMKHFITALCVLLAVAAAQIFVAQRCDHQTRALIMRAQFIMFIQSVMLTFSYIDWKYFSDLPKYFSLLKQTVLQRQIHVPHDAQEATVSKKVDSYMTKWKYVLLTYLCMCHISYFTNMYLIGTDPHWFAMTAYACLGSFIQLNVSLMICRFVSCLIRKAGLDISLFGGSVHKDNSKLAVILLSFIYTILASTRGLYVASQPPAVRHVEIPIQDLPRNLHGLSIVQLSDIHLGPTVGFSKLKMIVDIVEKENSDVVVLTGDLADGKADTLKQAAFPFKSIVPRYGKYFITGNHEYYTGDVDNWFSLLRSLGFTILHNSNVRIPPPSLGHTGKGICLAGTDDIQADKVQYGSHRFDLHEALSSCSLDLPVILLAHQPKAARMALDSKYRVDLVLSGHTHGGQLFPMMLGAYLLNPFYAGLYSEGLGGRHVYVSTGTQYWGIPMRIGTSMEITRITLVPTHSS